MPRTEHPIKTIWARTHPVFNYGEWVRVMGHNGTPGKVYVAPYGIHVNYTGVTLVDEAILWTSEDGYNNGTSYEETLKQA